MELIPTQGLDGKYCLTFYNFNGVDEADFRKDFESCGDIAQITDVNRRVFVRFTDYDGASTACKKFAEKYRLELPKSREDRGDRRPRDSNYEKNGNRRDRGDHRRDRGDNKRAQDDRPQDIVVAEASWGDPSSCKVDSKPQNKRSPRNTNEWNNGNNARQSSKPPSLYGSSTSVNACTLENKSVDNTIESEPPPLTCTLEKDTKKFCLILGNLPYNSSLENVYSLVAEMTPEISELDTTLGKELRFCQVYVDAYEKLAYLVTKLDGFILNNQKLIAMELKQLLNHLDGPPMC